MIDELIKELRKDKSEGSLYYVYQSNIAMAFKDEFSRANKDEYEKSYSDIHKIDIHEIANQAAKNFLDLLIRERDYEHLNDIDTESKEGRLLMAAIGIITGTHRTDAHPDVVLREIDELQKKMYINEHN